MPMSRSHREERNNSQEENKSNFTFQGQNIESHPELVNLAEYLDEETLEEVATTVIEEYEEDEESRQEWLRMQAEWIRLYYQKDYPANPPWEGASKESMPILVEGCNQFHARAYKAFFGGPKLVTAVPIGEVQEADRERSERVGKFMSWQLEIKDRSYKRNKDRLLRSLPLHGSVFTKVYRDPIRKRNVVENVRAIDLVVPYASVGMDIEDVERKTHVIYMGKQRCEYLAKTGWFTDVPEPYDEGSDNPVTDAVDEATGMTPPTKTENKSAVILEQHRFWDFDGDGLSEPYIVWVDKETEKVIRISIRYSTDPMGVPTNNKEPLEFFTHYAYIENPDGFYGLGLGHMTGGLNKSVNKILRQSLDAATLQNLRPGFASKQLGLKKGYNEFELGKIKTLDGVFDDIRKVLFFIEHPGPSQALIGLMSGLTDRADRLNMVTDMLTGDPDKVYQPTTAMAQIEQGLMTFSAVQTRVYAALEQELSKLYRLNGIYLNETEYFTLMDAMGQNAAQQQQVFRADFIDNLQVRPILDPNMATEEAKMQRARVEYEAGMQNPIIQQNPMHLLNVTRRFFEAIGSKNLQEILPTPQQLQQMVQDRQKQQQQGMQMEAQLAQAEVQTDQQANQIDAYEAQTERFKAQGELSLKSSQIQAKNELDQVKVDIQRAKTVADLETAIAQNRIGGFGENR